MNYGCRFCIALYGLKGSEVASLPDNEADAWRHVRSVHGYPQRTAVAILGTSPAQRAAAKIIEELGPIIQVTQMG